MPVPSTRAIRLLVPALALLSAGCSPTPSSGSRGGMVAVTASRGSSPEYRWRGGSAFSVSVVRVTAPSEVIWGVAADSARPLDGPVQHGRVPPGSLALSAAEALLSPGVLYRVSVTLVDGRTGYLEFTTPSRTYR